MGRNVVIADKRIKTDDEIATQIKVDDINMLLTDEDDSFYYDKVYRVSFAVANALNPCFEIYAYHEMDALERVYNALPGGMRNFLFLDQEDYDQLDETEQEQMISLDGCVYADSAYLAIVDVT